MKITTFPCWHFWFKDSRNFILRTSTFHSSGMKLAFGSSWKPNEPGTYQFVHCQFQTYYTPCVKKTKKQFHCLYSTLEMRTHNNTASKPNKIMFIVDTGSLVVICIYIWQPRRDSSRVQTKIEAPLWVQVPLAEPKSLHSAHCGRLFGRSVRHTQ